MLGQAPTWKHVQSHLLQPGKSRGAVQIAEGLLSPGQPLHAVSSGQETGTWARSDPARGGRAPGPSESPSAARCLCLPPFVFVVLSS